MKIVLVLLFISYCNCGTITLPATTLVRAPSHDSAIIQSERVGGNFAYNTIEGHAYAAISPLVRNAQMPVAVSYSSEPVVAPMVQVPIYAAQYGASFTPAAPPIVISN